MHCPWLAISTTHPIKITQFFLEFGFSKERKELQERLFYNFKIARHLHIKTSGAKLSRLLIHGGTTVLKSVLDDFHPPLNLAADLNTNRPILNNLFREKKSIGGEIFFFCTNPPY